MLSIESTVLRELKRAFLNERHEQGCILGSKETLDRIDCCKLIPAMQSGEYFYTPDNRFADITIQTWAEGGICLNGFIHSHTNGQIEFSDNDLLFANKLLDNFCTPYLWFGLAVITDQNDMSLIFYRICKNNDQLILNPETIQII